VDWERFTLYGWYRNYERVVYRKLRCERTEEKLSRLQEFIKAARNKRYKMTATKLLRKNRSDDSDANISDHKTYFCSELVASIYKNLGILP
jgi:hypothetical protein